MATLTKSNNFLEQMGNGSVDFTSDTFKVILTNGLSFSADTHGTYADVSGSELATANGYTNGGETLAVATAWNQDDVNGKAYIEWSNVVWTGSGGSFGPFDAAIIYDDTHTNKVVVGAIEFGTDITVTDGNDFTLKDLGYDYT